MNSNLTDGRVVDDRTLRVLEFHKIRERLRELAASALTRARIDALLPMQDARLIDDALSDTDEALAVIGDKGVPPFGRFHDIAHIVDLATKQGSLTPGQLLDVAYNLRSARRTAAFLSEDVGHLPRVSGLGSALYVLRDLEESITRSILSEDEIADDASPLLRRLRRNIVRQGEAIRQQVQRIVASSEHRSILQDTIVTLREGRYVIPVKQEHKSRFPGVVHDQSASGATVFIEPQTIVNMNNELRELELEEVKEIRRILQELSGNVGLHARAIAGNQEILTELDFMFAKGRLASAMRASRPAIEGQTTVRLRRGRHPLIDAEKVVPVDVRIGTSYRTLVITGPNTGGKTVTLKTVGLLCCMAQAGLFVPAEAGTELPVFTRIFADIGDEQSIEQSLSTFSSHMNNIVDIVQEAGEQSLVLLDELGAGTDPTEGAALAMSILDYLYAQGATTLATTHYTELKKYALATDGVQNASMEFDVDTLSPTFRLSIGLPGKSNAFEIAQKLGLSEELIGRARLLLESGDIRFEDVLATIERERKDAEAEHDEAVLLKLSLTKQQAQLARAQERLAAEEERILEQARAEARDLLREARDTVTEAQREIDRARTVVDTSERGDARRALETRKRTLREQERSYRRKPSEVVNPDPPKRSDIRPGIRVNVLSVDQKGNVLTEPDDRGNITVQVGLLKLTVNLKDVTLVQENVTDKEREAKKYSRMYHSKALEVQTSLNVIGRNLDEAEMEVDKYLDDAFLAGLGQVQIIHGRGEGILRDGLRTMLRRHRHVASVRPATFQEGGEAITIVSLKK